MKITKEQIQKNHDENRAYADHLIRTSNFPIPEGTGREHWPKEELIESIPYRGDSFVGVREKTDIYFDNIWVGSILNIRDSSGNCYYKTHCGKKFHHYGGETGIEPWIKNRYWLYGNPPKPSFLRKLLKRDWLDHKPFSERFFAWAIEKLKEK